VFRKKGPLVFANGGPKKATGGVNAGGRLLPKHHRRVLFLSPVFDGNIVNGSNYVTEKSPANSQN
jgi:hypothetical protein